MVLCKITPQHLNPDGTVMDHKNRLECSKMLREGTLGALPLEGRAQVPQSATSSAPAPDAAQPGTSPPAEAEVPSKPKKKRLLGFLHKPAGVPTEAASEADVERSAPIPRWTLSEKLTAEFWGFVFTGVADLVALGDKAFGVDPKKRFDASSLKLTASEKAMAGEHLAEPTTGLLKKLGFKTLEAATAFISGLFLVRIFARVFLLAGAHMVTEWPKGANYVAWKNRPKKQRQAMEREVEAEPQSFAVSTAGETIYQPVTSPEALNAEEQLS